MHNSRVEYRVSAQIVLRNDHFSLFRCEDVRTGEFWNYHEVHTHIQHSGNVHLLPDKSIKIAAKHSPRRPLSGCKCGSTEWGTSSVDHTISCEVSFKSVDPVPHQTSLRNDLANRITVDKDSVCRVKVLGEFDAADVGSSHTASVEQGGADPVGEGLGVAETILSVVVDLRFLSIVSQKVQRTTSDLIHIIERELFEHHSIVESLEALRIHLIGDLGKCAPGSLIQRGLTEFVPGGECTPVQRFHFCVPLDVFLHRVSPLGEQFDDLALAGFTAPGDVAELKFFGGHVEVDCQVVGHIAGLFNAVPVGGVPIRYLLESREGQVHDVG